MPFVSPLMLATAEQNVARLDFEGLSKSGTASAGPFTACNGITILSNPNGMFGAVGDLSSDEFMIALNNSIIAGGNTVRITIINNNYSISSSNGTFTVGLKFYRAGALSIVGSYDFPLIVNDVKQANGYTDTITLDSNDDALLGLYTTTSATNTTGGISDTCDVLIEKIS
jgi:hypothetical protein